MSSLRIIFKRTRTSNLGHESLLVWRVVNLLRRNLTWREGITTDRAPVHTEKTQKNAGKEGACDTTHANSDRQPTLKVKYGDYGDNENKWYKN